MGELWGGLELLAMGPLSPRLVSQEMEVLGSHPGQKVPYMASQTPHGQGSRNVFLLLLMVLWLHRAQGWIPTHPPLVLMPPHRPPSPYRTLTGPSHRTPNKAPLWGPPHENSPEPHSFSLPEKRNPLLRTPAPIFVFHWPKRHHMYISKAITGGERMLIPEPTWWLGSGSSGS